MQQHQSDFDFWSSVYRIVQQGSSACLAMATQRRKRAMSNYANNDSGKRLFYISSDFCLMYVVNKHRLLTAY